MRHWRARSEDECYHYSMSTEELLAKALQLSRPERARVAEELLASLEESDEQVAEAWAQELERRSREIEDGTVEPIPWERVRDNLRAELKARRASRGSSGSER
jgi:putative addiction module component (TIGR02574 family)